jgi:hypothetical protein
MTSCNRLRCALAVGLVACVGVNARCRADTPLSSYIFPAGAQRGTTVQCRVGGLNLTGECGFRVIGSGIDAPARIRSMRTLVLIGPYHHNPIAQQAWDYPKDMSLTAGVAPDAELGARYWYCTTSEGATQLRPFIVGDLPEALELEPETVAGRPQPITVPVTVNGRIFPRADLDEYEFEARAGTPISCEVMSQRLGHKLDATLALYDAAGKIVAKADDYFGRDPLLLAEIPADGRYVLRIHDIAFEGEQDYVYRLSVRAGPCVTHVFPAGGRRGSTVAARLYGAGLGATGVADHAIDLNAGILSSPALAAGNSGIRELPGSTMSLLLNANPAVAGQPAAGSTAVVSNLPAGTLSSQCHVVSGFQVSDLEETVESEPNDAVSAAQLVPIPGATNGQLATPHDVDQFAFHAEKGAAIDFEFFGRRLGSPITGVCTLTDGQGAVLARHEGDARFTFVPPATGDFNLRVHELHHGVNGGPEYIYRIVATLSRPDFRLVLESDNVAVQPGQTAKVKLNVVRTGQFAGEIQLAADELPPGVSCTPPLIAPNQNQIELVFAAARDAAIGRTQRVHVFGSASIGDATVRHPAELSLLLPAAGNQSAAIDSLAVTVGHPSLFSIDTDEVFANANRGAAYSQRFVVERQNGFDGPITLELADRQARYLQGVTGPVVTVLPGQREVDFPVFLPDSMDLNRTARVLLTGTAEVQDASGVVHRVTSTTKKQIAVRVSPSMLSVSADEAFIEGRRGETLQIPLRLGRTTEITAPVIVEPILPGGSKGITASPVEVAPGEETVILSVELAADAAMGFDNRLRFRARTQRRDLPVIAETSVEFSIAGSR